VRILGSGGCCPSPRGERGKKIPQDAPFDVCDRSGARLPSFIPMGRAACPDDTLQTHTRGLLRIVKKQTQLKRRRPRRVSAWRRVIGSARIVGFRRRRPSRGAAVGPIHCRVSLKAWGSPCGKNRVRSGLWRSAVSCCGGIRNHAVLRTRERRIRQWRALNGPDRAAIFRQTAAPGRMGMSDFTPVNGCGVTIDGVPRAHRLSHFRRPWSGFCHAHGVPGGESFAALSTGLQDAVQSVGSGPQSVQASGG